jgi:hypothetical protein
MCDSSFKRTNTNLNYNLIAILITFPELLFNQGAFLFYEMRSKYVIELLKETFSDWNEDKVSRLEAVLACYTVFSLSSLLECL